MDNIIKINCTDDVSIYYGKKYLYDHCKTIRDMVDSLEGYFKERNIIIIKLL